MFKNHRRRFMRMKENNGVRLAEGRNNTISRSHLCESCMAMNPPPPEDQDQSNPTQSLGFRKPPLMMFQQRWSMRGLGLFLITMGLILCFLYLDYMEVIGDMYRVPWNQKKGSVSRVDYLKEEGNGCDVFDGEWVWDNDFPLSKDCRFMDGGIRCQENGRPDLFYTKWRWQPKHCTLPRSHEHISSR